MDGLCGAPQSGPTRLWRNGLDYEPKKSYPPDYSNVISVRDWQMSPFGNARYDLDEIQRAEKRGYKGRHELERLRSMYGGGKAPSPCEEPPCSQCLKREAQDQARADRRVRCTDNTLYQPYGPAVVSSVSYNRADLNKPRMYSYMGPSFYAGFQFSTPAPEMTPTVPCSSVPYQPSKILKNTYLPYGPYSEVRLTPDLYLPMGPSTIPLDLSF